MGVSYRIFSAFSVLVLLACYCPRSQAASQRGTKLARLKSSGKPFNMANLAAISRSAEAVHEMTSTLQWKLSGSVGVSQTRWSPATKLQSQDIRLSRLKLANILSSRQAPRELSNDTSDQFDHNKIIYFRTSDSSIGNG